MNRMILKDAAKQLRQARADAEFAGEDWEGPVSSSTTKEVDLDVMADLRRQRREAGDTFKVARRKLARGARRENAAAGKMRIEWTYEPGELVKIKDAAFRRNKYRLEQLSLYPGAVGVVVEPEDDKWRSAAGGLLHVMGPMGLQAWQSSWVEIVEDE